MEATAQREVVLKLRNLARQEVLAIMELLLNARKINFLLKSVQLNALPVTRATSAMAVIMLQTVTKEVTVLAPVPFHVQQELTTPTQLEDHLKTVSPVRLGRSVQKKAQLILLLLLTVMQVSTVLVEIRIFLKRVALLDHSVHWDRASLPPVRQVMSVTELML